MLSDIGGELFNFLGTIRIILEILLGVGFPCKLVEVKSGSNLALTLK